MAADLGAWLGFEDESGQGLGPIAWLIELPLSYWVGGARLLGGGMRFELLEWGTAASAGGLGSRFKAGPQHLVATRDERYPMGSG
jgi:hypothetical protein